MCKRLFLEISFRIAYASVRVREDKQVLLIMHITSLRDVSFKREWNVASVT